MAKISREELQPGMKVAEDLKDQRGRTLLPAGGVVDRNNIRGLQVFGPETVLVEDIRVPLASQGKAKGKALPPEVIKAQEYANALFRLNLANSDSPILKQMFLQAVKRMVKNGLPESAHC